MNDKQGDVVVPVIQEELHADARPVVTGGVRVTKRLEPHEQILEQELRKTHVEVKRVKTDRVVDGPQPVQRTGNRLIIPIVSEVLTIQKRWVVTEEIHIIEREERDTVQKKVTVNREEAQIERIDASGNVLGPIAADPAIDPKQTSARVSRSRSILKDHGSRRQ